MKKVIKVSQGRSPDLGETFFRSKWERNYARFLNFTMKQGCDVLKWQYEPETFWFRDIQRGTRSYKPDFKVWVTGGAIEYHEVKGFDYPRGRTARKRMAKYYPGVKLILIGPEWFKEMNRSKMWQLIPGWERDEKLQDKKLQKILDDLDERDRKGE